jgi:hypothetical protein
MSSEELRDLYKNSGKSNDTRLKLNGATFRKIRASHKYKAQGNTIVIRDGMGGMRHVADLNEKYGLEEGNRIYSLNKKNRWELAGELKQNMSGFASDDIDVRLYETSNRNEKKSNNCISVMSSQNDDVSVKNTYANLNSLRAEFELKKTRQLEGPVLTKKQQRQKAAEANANKGRQQKPPGSSKPSLNTRKMDSEHIVINVDSDGEEVDDESYVQYEIEYAPKKDILKYGIDIYKPCKSNKQTGKKSGALSRSDEDFDEIDCSDEEDDDSDAQVGPSEERLELSLDELINVHLVSMIEKQYVMIGNEANSRKNSNEASEAVHPKDKKIFVEKKEASGASTPPKSAPLR